MQGGGEGIRFQIPGKTMSGTNNASANALIFFMFPIPRNFLVFDVSLASKVQWTRTLPHRKQLAPA